jgi:hypothetical protein
MKNLIYHLLIIALIVIIGYAGKTYIWDTFLAKKIGKAGPEQSPGVSLPTNLPQGFEVITSWEEGYIELRRWELRMFADVETLPREGSGH